MCHLLLVRQAGRGRCLTTKTTRPDTKGSGAFGVFETTEDVSQYTKAALFQKGARTDTLVREVFDDAMRERFVQNVAGHILGGVKDETLPKVFEYWTNVDAEIGKRIEEAVHAGKARDVAPHATQARPSEVVDNPSVNKG